MSDLLNLANAQQLLTSCPVNGFLQALQNTHILPLWLELLLRLRLNCLRYKDPDG